MPQRQRLLLLTLSLVTGAVLLNVSAPNVALPSIAADFRAGPSAAQWVISAYALALAAVLLSAGVLADRTGRRRVLLGGLGLFLAASALAAAAPSVELLVIARALQGIGAAGAFASSNAAIAESFEGLARARALGILGGTIALSFAIGPLLGGVLVQLAGWRGLFAANVALGLGAFALARAHMPESRHPDPAGFDWAGTALSAGGLASIVAALSVAGGTGGSAPVVVGALLAGAALLAAFVVVELREAHPMLDVRLFSRPSFAVAGVSAFTSTIAAFCTTIFLTLFLVEGLDHSPLRAGLELMPSALVAFPVSLAAGRFAAHVRLGARLAIGLGMLAVGVLVLRSSLAADTGWADLLPGLVALGAGAGIANPAISYAALNSTETAHAGAASGVNYTFRQVALAAGTAGLTSLLATRLPASPTPAEYTEALRPVLVVCMAAPLLGSGFALALAHRI